MFALLHWKVKIENDFRSSMGVSEMITCPRSSPKFHSPRFEWWRSSQIKGGFGLIIYNLLIPGGTMEWGAEKGGRGTAAARRGSLAPGSVMDSFSNLFDNQISDLGCFFFSWQCHPERLVSTEVNTRLKIGKIVWTRIKNLFWWTDKYCCCDKSCCD